MHLAWSGDKRVWAERQALGYGVLGAGELLAPGEVSLSPGESSTTPWTVAVYSGEGIDGWFTGRTDDRRALFTLEARLPELSA